MEVSDTIYLGVNDHRFKMGSRRSKAPFPVLRTSRGKGNTYCPYY